MKLLVELSNELFDKAMSGEAIVAWWQQRARCIRCAWYDKSDRMCKHYSSEMLGREVRDPALFACVHFDD